MPGGEPRVMTVTLPNFTDKDRTPTPDEVARRAYFAYLNRGSLHGHDVEDWLAAEAELIAERKPARVHGYHSPASPRSQTTYEKPVIL